MATLGRRGDNGFPLARDLNPSRIRIDDFKPLGREVRKHPPAQIRKLAASIAHPNRVLRGARGHPPGLADARYLS
jgi:hypothetical protein